MNKIIALILLHTFSHSYSINSPMHVLETVIERESSNAITYELNGGRFGDNIRSLVRALKIAKEFGLQFFYVPFRYSNKLMVEVYKEKYTKDIANQFSHIVYLPAVSAKNLQGRNTLYICHWGTKVKMDWSDLEFVEEVKQLVAPRYPEDLELVAIPEGYISVAVHVRTGGTYGPDTTHEKERNPLRFSTDEFCIDQIARIAEIFPEDRLYVHIFTDHSNPDKLKRKYEKALNNPRILFGCREEGNAHNSNVLDDFFSMMNFDCLIRPCSNFSRFVHYLGNNKLVIYPSSFKKIDGKKVFDVITIKTRPEVGVKWKTTKVTIA